MQQDIGIAGITVLTIAVLFGVAWWMYVVARGVNRAGDAADSALQKMQEIQFAVCDRISDLISNQEINSKEATAEIVAVTSDVISPLLVLIQRMEAIEATIQNASLPSGLLTEIAGLSDSMRESIPYLKEISDNSFLIAKGARDFADQVAALRSVIFGGSRAEDMPITVNDSDGVNRANMESEIQNLMLDHKMTRAEADKRVRDAYGSGGRSRRG